MLGVHKVVNDNKGKAFGPFFDDIQDYCVANVLCSAAALEAFINEVYSDRKLHFKDHDIELLNDLWGVIEPKPILEKYQLALSLKSRPKMEAGGTIVEHAKALIKFRNALVHFRPEWVHMQKEHAKLGVLLNGKFKTSEFVLDTDPVFPLGCMSHDMTLWAINTSYNLISEFCLLAEIENKLERFKTSLGGCRTDARQS